MITVCTLFISKDTEDFPYESKQHTEELLFSMFRSTIIGSSKAGGRYCLQQGPFEGTSFEA
jgi:hypothetical protein